MSVEQRAAEVGLPQLDPLEVASGVVYGPRRTPAPDLDDRPAGTPKETLETILLRALRRPPCIVAFSGGRDSSAILAEAARVARKHGLDDPIPYTMRFDEAPRTGEVEWQQLVIDHLGLDEWRQQSITNELDALGPVGAGVLRRHGVHWPPNIHTFQVWLDAAAGGSLLTGNGGDELFTAWLGHRIAVLRRARDRPHRYDVKPLLLYLLPQELFIRRSVRQGRFRLPWLLPEAAREVQRGAADEMTRIDTSWEKRLENYLDSRYREVGLAVGSAMASASDIQLVEPFFDAAYIRSAYAAAPVEGYPSRTAAMTAIFGDELPEKVTSRSTKAVFTEVFAGAETRRFAEEWDGAGLDPELVDAEALRRVWLAPRVDIRSLVPLQAAWLAANG